MDWTWYLFGFEGRINRVRHWLAGLVISCWMVFVMLLLALPLGYLFGSPFKFGFSVDSLFVIFHPASLRDLSRSDIVVTSLNVLFMPLFLWVFLATTVKRLHDRDRSGWWTVPFLVIPGVYDRIANWLPDAYWLVPLGLVCIVLFSWGFIELYFLSGSPKTNRFGADPLAPRDTRPAWDQQSEIEMVPRKASPPPVGRVMAGHE
jgi:uncharacterized membrane protein YhaH (DUF805 family)